MKRHRLMAGMLLGVVLLAPQQGLAETSEEPLGEAVAVASTPSTNSDHKDTTHESVETHTAPYTQRNLADCSYTPDETFAVTDGICH